MTVNEKAQAANIVGWFQPHVRPQWDGKIDKVDKDGVVTRVPDPAAVSMTKQSFAKECDINEIVRRFEATGNWDHVAQKLNQGYYDDLPSGLDLQIGLQQIEQAETAFMALPADFRAQFDNSPVKWLEAMERPTEALLTRLDELGLAKLRKPAEPQISGPKAADPVPSPNPSSDGSKK